MFDNMVGIQEGKKIIAMTENGTIPDPDKLQADKARWSWFMTWSDDFIMDGIMNESLHINKVYNHDYVITFDELPDFDSYVSPEPGGEEEEEVVTGLPEGLLASVRAYPNPVTDRLKVVFQKKGLPNVIGIYDQLGQALVVIEKTNIRQEMEIDLSTYSSGMYIMRLMSDEGSQSVRLLKK